MLCSRYYYSSSKHNAQLCSRRCAYVVVVVVLTLTHNSMQSLCVVKFLKCARTARRAFRSTTTSWHTIQAGLWLGSELDFRVGVVSAVIFNPFRTAVPFWGQTAQISSSLSPKRDCGPKWVKRSDRTLCVRMKTSCFYGATGALL